VDKQDKFFAVGAYPHCNLDIAKALELHHAY
jgi:hypothetical protein